MSSVAEYNLRGVFDPLIWLRLLFVHCASRVIIQLIFDLVYDRAIICIHSQQSHSRLPQGLAHGVGGDLGAFVS